MEIDSNCIRFDWAAKYVLRDKADFTILEGLVSTVIGESVTIVELLESESNQKTKDDIFKRINIEAINHNNETIFITIQISGELYYLESILNNKKCPFLQYNNTFKVKSNAKQVFFINILYFEFGEGDDYLYHGNGELLGVNTGNQLKMTTNEQRSIRFLTENKTSLEYYLLRVANFESTVLSSDLEEWMVYLKEGFINPTTKALGLKKAYERFQIDAMSVKDYKAYRGYMEDLMYENSVLAAAKFK